jgi:Xaa-Pro aminopeptidase
LDLEKRRYLRLLDAMQESQIDGLVVTHPPNLNYLVGFTGSAAIAVCEVERCVLIVDSRYLEQAQEETHGCTILLSDRSPEEFLHQSLDSRPSTATFAFEASHTTYESGQKLLGRNSGPGFIPITSVVDQVRIVKDASEVRLIKKSLQVSQDAYQEAIQQLRPGLSEHHFAGILELTARVKGAQGMSFETIIASGSRSALPHGLASRKTIQEGEPVLVDFGIRFEDYCSDLTRFIQSSSGLESEIVRIVSDAQSAAMAVIRPGIPASEVDSAARKVISSHGYGEYFGHSTGHGLGLEIHELPRIAPRSSALLQPGMVFTVEPGIYLPGRFGVRLEDVVLVTDSGFELLSDPER